jgi:hypothetical protein
MYLIKKYPEEIYSCCYQLCGTTVDQYGLPQTSEAWMEDGIERFWDKSEKEVVRELHFQEEINSQQYYLANGGKK